jgi:5-methylcytosine-specific restriction enzyme A
MRPQWTTDEIVLGLDVLFKINCLNITMNNPEIIQLSELLNQMPIIPIDKRGENFRNIAGVSGTLRNFYAELNQKIISYKVGRIFFEVYDYYKTEISYLHKIANAIRRCLFFANSLTYGDPIETNGFPEGAILSHVHRNIETRYTESCQEIIEECEICGIKPNRIYVDVGTKSILGKHLLVAPKNLNPQTKYTLMNYINVCPNCHRALHLTRPWCTRVNCESILRV